MLHVTEIFRSIQGESSAAGLPCTFVRLSGCNLRCAYCDTAYAREPGPLMEITEIVERVEALGEGLIEVTGGEPLLQPRTLQLLDALVTTGRPVMLETNGSLLLPAERNYRVIMDMKCPSSGQADTLCASNIDLLRPNDEIKFVVGPREDFDWALEQLHRHDLLCRDLTILFGPVFGVCDPAGLADWILETNLNLRLQLQLHRLIWPARTRGV